MTGKDLMLKAIKRERTPRVPTVLLSGGAWTFNNRGFTLEQVLGKPELAAEIIIETNQLVQSDVVWLGSGYNNLPLRVLGAKTKFRPKGTMDVIEPAASRPEDIVSIRPERLEEDPDLATLWESTELVDQAIGDTTLIGASGWGPFTFAAQLYGTERLMRGIYKDKAGVKAVLDAGCELALYYYMKFVRAGAKIISIGEPTASGDLISRLHFAEFALPCIKKFMESTRRAGSLNLLHICGNITDRLELLGNIGVDVLSVDYKVSLADVRSVLGNKLAFAGNVNPVTILNGSPGDIAAAAQKCINMAGDGGGYILMPGCDIPPAVPIENIQSFMQTGLNWQLSTGSSTC